MNSGVLYTKNNNKLNYIPVKIFKNNMLGLFDTGASVSGISWNAVKLYKL